MDPEVEVDLSSRAPEGSPLDAEPAVRRSPGRAKAKAPTRRKVREYEE